MKGFKLVLCILLCVGGGWLMGLFTEHSVRTWYVLLNKPAWTPPNYLFPIAWTFLYTLMAISLWLVWTSSTQNKTAAIIAFLVQLIFNFKWSWLFFYLESPALALADLVLLLVSIVVTMALFWRHSRLATYLLLPYLGWVFYAFSLNLFIWKHN